MVVDSLDRVNMVYESGQDLRLRRIAPDGTLGDARTVGPSLSPARPTGLAIDPQDRIAVVGDGDHPQIPVRATRIAPDGTAAPVTSLPAGGKGSRVVIDSEGRATVVWHGPATFQPGFVELGPVHAVRIAADGTPGPLLTLSEGDDSPPAVTVEAETPQAPKDEVVVRAGCDEYCFLRAEGRLAIRRGRQARAVAKRLRLRRDEDVNFDGRSRNFITRSLRLGIKPEGRRVAIRALKRGHRVVAKVHVLAADPSGNISTDRVSVRLKRERG